MTPPVALHWDDDVPVLQEYGHQIEPVTAWAIVSGMVGPEQGDEVAFFAALDESDPLNWLRSSDQLQCVFSVDQGCSAQTFKLIDNNARTNMGMASPRLFRLPLRRDSLATDAEGVVILDKVHGSFGTTPGQETLPKLRSLPNGSAGQDRPAAIVGIIDYAINIAHARFLHVDKDGKRRSRVAHTWLQEGEHHDDPVPFGREIKAAQIETALLEAGSDEETALRRLGQLGFGGGTNGKATVPRTELGRRASHGTHVLDLAAGMDPADANGMAVQIIAVALPDAVRRDTTGSLLSLFFLSGLEYILLRSRDIGRDTGLADDCDIPTFICASLGFGGGPRGGQHLIERSIEAALQHHVEKVGGQPDNARVFLPAGNSNLARGHAVSCQGVGEVTLAVPWRLQPGDRTANHLEAWIAYEGESPPERVEISLEPPGKLQAPERRELKPGESKLLVLVKGEDTGPEEGAEPEHRAVGRAAFEEMPGDLFRLTIALAATDPGLSGRPAAAPGAWGLEITARAPEGSATKLEINAWILRDDDPFEHSANARQSYFDAPDYIERDPSGELKAKDPKSPGSVVRRCGSLNAIATGSEREVVGGFVQPPPGAQGAAQVPTPAPYSGTPLPAKERLLDSTEAVAWSAPCESSKVLSGVLAAGTRSGSLTAMNGTSAAVPQVVRAKVNPFWDPEPKQIHFFPAAEPGKEPDPRLGKRPIRSPLAHNRIEARATPRRSDPRL